VTQVNRRFAGRAGFLGALQGGFEQISLNDGEAGAVFLVEVLKHLELDDMGRVLAELERVLRPGGHLIITVPNKENLDARIEPVSVATLDFHDFVGNALSRAVKS
jgi:SAM-dependent methyltransferase